MSWNFLPEEIRLMILHILTASESHLAQYASVCGEWKQFIEAKTFYQLEVTVQRLEKLDALTTSRRKLVRRINFTIECPNYNCWECVRDILRSNEALDDSIICYQLNTLCKLLAIREWNKKGITLDIDIFCSRAERDYYKYSTIFTNADIDKARYTCQYYLCHGWRNEGLGFLPSLASRQRHSQQINLDQDSRKSQLYIRAVSTLQVRRQIDRAWSVEFLKWLLPHFPMLQTIYCEPWISYTSYYAEVFQALPTEHLTKIVAFGHFAQIYRDIFHGDPWPDQHEQNGNNVAKALAQVSLGLESLSVSYIVDANFFFGTCDKVWIWEKLRTLAITSEVMIGKAPSSGKINKLLSTAAAVALRMPVLDHMVLWGQNTNEGFGAFIYQISMSEHCAELTWRATWDMDLVPDMVQLWEEVAFKRARITAVVIKKDVLDRERAGRPICDTIISLKLPCEVVHEASLRQMQEEAARTITLFS